MRWFTLALAACAAVAVQNAAQASLIGQEFNATYEYPSSGTAYGSAVFTPTDFVVGSQVETIGLVEGVTSITIDIAATSLRITFSTGLDGPTWGAVAFNGVVLTSPTALDVAGGTVEATSTLSGFDNRRVQVTGTQILLNWQGLAYTNGTTLDLAFTPIPEPMSLGLLGLALAGLTLQRRRRVGAAAG